MYYLVQIDAALIIQKQTETKKHRTGLDVQTAKKHQGNRETMLEIRKQLRS